MKKLIMIVPFLGIFISILCLASCNRGIDDVDKSQEMTKYKSEISENRELLKFLGSVDSLGEVYSQRKIGYSRGAFEKFRNDVGKSTVDLAGFVAGRYIGRWLGGAAGSLTGNVGVTIVGWYAGGKYGPYIVSTLASGIANIWLSCEGVIDNNKDIEPVGNFDMSINGDARNDSIGFFHNSVMCKISTNEDKYIQEGNVNIDVLYDDIIKYCAEYGYYIEDFEKNQDLKEAIIGMILDYTDMVKLYKEDVISEDEMINMQTEKLVSDFSLNEEETLLLKDFSYKVVVDCAGLTDENVWEYAKALNALIENSSMTDSIKEDVAFSAQMAINSTICWKQ